MLLRIFGKVTIDTDCWIFGDALEHLRYLWLTLKCIRNYISQAGMVMACIPNAKHGSLQVRLSISDFRYEENGLLDKTHLRWFKRQTIIELFDQKGFSNRCWIAPYF